MTVPLILAKDVPVPPSYTVMTVSCHCTAASHVTVALILEKDVPVPPY